MKKNEEEKSDKKIMKRYDLSLDKSELLFIIKLFDFFNNHHNIIEDSDEEEIYRNIYFMIDSIQIEIEDDEKKMKKIKK